MSKKSKGNTFNGDALFFFRGRLSGTIKQRKGHWLFTMVVRCGNETYFPTITLTTAPPQELRYLDGMSQRNQQLLSVVGIPKTRNVTYSTIGEIGYLLRRAGYAGLITLFKRMLPAQAQEAPQRHVRYNFMASPEDITIEETPAQLPVPAGATPKEKPVSPKKPPRKRRQRQKPVPETTPLPLVSAEKEEISEDVSSAEPPPGGRAVLDSTPPVDTAPIAEPAPPPQKRRRKKQAPPVAVVSPEEAVETLVETLPESAEADVAA